MQTGVGGERKAEFKMARMIGPLSHTLAHTNLSLLFGTGVLWGGGGLGWCIDRTGGAHGGVLGRGGGGGFERITQGEGKSIKGTPRVKMTRGGGMS